MVHSALNNQPTPTPDEASGVSKGAAPSAPDGAESTGAAVADQNWCDFPPALPTSFTHARTHNLTRDR